MAQPHKGDRLLIAVRVDVPVWESTLAAAENRGTSLSQHVADQLAVHVGRPDLVSTRPEKLPPRRREPASANGRVCILTRPQREVGRAIQREATKQGISASQYVEGLLADQSADLVILRAEEPMLLAM